MPQLHLYVPETTARLLRKKAEEKSVSLSGYLAEIVTSSLESDERRWPEGFFEGAIGGWEGELRRSPQGLYEDRGDLSNGGGS